MQAEIERPGGQPLPEEPTTIPAARQALDDGLSDPATAVITPDEAAPGAVDPSAAEPAPWAEVAAAAPGEAGEASADASVDADGPDASGGADEDAPQAFETLGLPEAADLMRRARSLLRDRGPVLEDAREEGTIEAFVETYGDDPFGALDAEYAEYEDAFRLRRLRFLREHADTIRHP